MPRNVEIKARVTDLAAYEAVVAALATDGPEHIDQDDTFFKCDAGRLKLRAFSESNGELIFYQRPDAIGPKESTYQMSPIAAVPQLRDALTSAYGQVGRVVKHRTVYVIGRTRVHLDTVEKLGAYVELEVVLADAESADVGVAEAHELMGRLGLRASQLVSHAYVDLLAKHGA